MGPISILFPNPAVKILEGLLWERARTRYLNEHPSDREDDASTIMRKVRTIYKDTVDATLREADHKVRSKWGEFKQEMVKDLRTSLITVLRMSELDWYSVEVGQVSCPEVIAVPYELLKFVTASLFAQVLRNGIDFEHLDDETLHALAASAAAEAFREVLDELRHKHEPVEIGDHHSHFVVAEVVKGDSYFLDEENHHSLIDMVILCNAGASLPQSHENIPKVAVKRWFDGERSNRKNNRRFTGDGWEIGFEQLKSWAIKA